MNRLIRLYQTSLGKKFIVAVTGIVMIGFLIGHMAGNLKVFLPALPDGTPDIDHYGHFLRTMGEPLVPYAFLLWVARIVLLISLILHVVCVMQLSSANLSAREVDYNKRSWSRATPSARWMMYTGLYLLGFIIVHLLHLTLGVLTPGFEHGRVMNNLQTSFSSPLWAIGYGLSMLVVALHLFHGTWSLFQTLGLDNPDRNRGLRRFAAVLSIVIAIGFVSVPASILTGLVKNPEPSRQAVAGEIENNPMAAHRREGM